MVWLIWKQPGKSLQESESFRLKPIVPVFVNLFSAVYTDTLNRFIGYAIQHDSMDILSFKELLKAYNAGRLSLPEISEQRTEVLCKTGEYRDDDSKLLRDLDYYEQNVGGTVNA